MNRILIIEDESVIRSALKRLLEKSDYSVNEAESAEEAEKLFQLQEFDLILSDLRLPGVAGTEVISKANPTPVLIMTSYASVPSAVDAMKQGAADYIAKPFDHDELLLLIKRTLEQSQQQRQQAVLKSELEQNYPVKGMVGQSPEMQEVCKLISKVAPTDATVLILGESGTGKELVARALHEKSKRSQAPFVVFNCAAVPEHQIEAELFGQSQEVEDTSHSLLAKARGGTIFLDEIGELPTTAQARLLRLLQGDEHATTEQMNLRIVAATHRDIRQLVQEQYFRKDLYFRLRVVEMTLPPLRERGDDIRDLSIFLLNKLCRQLNRPAITLSHTALKAIRRYNWPGNVRELSNAIERAIILCDSDNITPELLAIDHPTAAASSQDNINIKENLSLEEYFRQFVLEHQGQMTETAMAKRLGISRKALWERRQRFGIPKPVKCNK